MDGSKQPQQQQQPPRKEKSSVDIERKPQQPRAEHSQMPMQSFGSLEDVSRFLARQLDRLEHIADSDKEGHRLETKAIVDYLKKHMSLIRKQFELEAGKVKNAIDTKLSELSSEHGQELEAALAEITARLETTFKQKAEHDMEDLANMYKETTNLKLKEQEEQLKAAFELQLKEQAEKLDRFYKEEVQVLVDKEREGRLARLDELTLKMKMLERLTNVLSERYAVSDRIHRLWACYFGLASLLEEGSYRAFDSHLKHLTRLSQDDPLIGTLLRSIPKEVASQGVISIEQLRSDFHPLRRRIHQFALATEEGGMMSLAVSYVLSFFMFEKHGLVDGSDIEARLARAEHYLYVESDVLRAIKEMNQLSGWNRRLAEDWLKNARQLAEVQQAVNALEAHLGLLSMGSV